MTARRVQKLKVEFSRLDKNGDRKLSFDEFKAHEERKHLGVLAVSAKLAFDQADSNGDGFLNFHEFKELVLLSDKPWLSRKTQNASAATSACSDGCSSNTSEEWTDDSLTSFMKVREGESFDHYLQRIEDEHPETNKRRRSTLETMQRFTSQRLPMQSPCESQRPVSQPVPQLYGKLRGPERFFYDRSTYTGRASLSQSLPSSLPSARPKLTPRQTKRQSKKDEESYLDEMLDNVGRQRPRLPALAFLH
jgi:hypothetical protein